MQLTKEILFAKRQLATDELEKLLAQANAQRGVIATLDNLIALIEAPEPPIGPEAGK